MKCIEDKCLSEAIEDTNFCAAHSWNRNVERYSDGDPPPPGFRYGDDEDSADAAASTCPDDEDPPPH